MHIAYLVSEYPHKEITSSCAGIGTAYKNLIQGLLPDVKISLFVYGQNHFKKIVEGNLTIYALEENKFSKFGFYLYRKKINKFINSIIEKEKINLIEAPDWTGITAFMKFPIPNIIRLHGSDAYFCYLAGDKQKWKNRLFEKIAYKNATAIISVSMYTKEITHKIFKVKKNATVIPNGIFPKDFSEVKMDTKENQVLYFGSLVRKKGVLELAEIFNELIVLNPKVKLIIAGRDVVDKKTGISTRKLIEDKLSNKAKINYEYKGVVSYEEIKSIIKEATVCVFPSLAESFGMVTIEAMAMKKAVVNTNYPWAKEIVKDKLTGLLEDPKKHFNFAEKINILLKDKKYRESIENEAYKHVTTYYSTEYLKDKNIEFYKEIIEKHEI